MSHRNINGKNAQAPINKLMHTYEYISTLPVMCSTQVSLLDWMNKSLISKIHLTQVCNIFGLQSHILAGFIQKDLVSVKHKE